MLMAGAALGIVGAIWIGVYYAMDAAGPIASFGSWNLVAAVAVIGVAVLAVLVALVIMGAAALAKGARRPV